MFRRLILPSPTPLRTLSLDNFLHRGRTPSERPGIHTAGGNLQRGPDMLPQPPCPAYRSPLPPLRHGYDSSPVWHPPGASHDQQPRRQEPRYGSRREEPRYGSRREERRYGSRIPEPSHGRGQSSIGQASYQQAPDSRHGGWSASPPRWVLNRADYNAPHDGRFESMDSRRGR